MRRLLSVFSAALIGLSLLPGVGRCPDRRVCPVDCALDENATVRVLLLIDQSGSLARTDPDDQRITGARAVVRSYASLADRVDRSRSRWPDSARTIGPGSGRS